MRTSRCRSAIIGEVEIAGWMSGSMSGMSSVELMSGTSDTAQIYYLNKDGSYNSSRVTCSTGKPRLADRVEIEENIYE